MWVQTFHDRTDQILLTGQEETLISPTYAELFSRSLPKMNVEYKLGALIQ